MLGDAEEQPPVQARKGRREQAEVMKGTLHQRLGVLRRGQGQGREGRAPLQRCLAVWSLLQERRRLQRVRRTKVVWKRSESGREKGKEEEEKLEGEEERSPWMRSTPQGSTPGALLPIRPWTCSRPRQQRATVCQRSTTVRATVRRGSTTLRTTAQG